MKARVVAQNKKYLVEFKSDEQMISFLTKHSHQIQKFDMISENELPAMKKTVELPKISQPTGWKTLEKSSIVNKETGAETKSMKLGGKYNTFKYEPDASLESNTSNKNSEGSIDSPALKGDKPKAKSVEDTKEFKNKFSKTEEKETEEKETEEKEIKESVKDNSIDKEEYEFGYTEAQSWFYDGNRFDHYDNDEVSDDFWEGFCDGWHDAENDINKFEVKESVEDTKKVSEGVKDYLPRGGFIKDDESGHKEGIWGGQGTDEQIRKAKLIAKVKHANGDRMGRVTKEDLDNYEYYLEQYQEIFGLNESKKSDKKVHIHEDDEFEKTHECSWCGEEFPESDMKCEKDMGWLCYQDWNYLESKEGDLEEVDPTEIGLHETDNAEKPFDLDDEFEKTHKCSWCGEEFPESDMKCEKEMGWLCNHDWKYLESKEGDLEECDPTEIGLDETETNEDYQNGFEEGKFAYEVGHFISYDDRNDLEGDSESEEFWRGYDDGYESAKEGLDDDEEELDENED